MTAANFPRLSHPDPSTDPALTRWHDALDPIQSTHPTVRLCAHWIIESGERLAAELRAHPERQRSLRRPMQGAGGLEKFWVAHVVGRLLWSIQSCATFALHASKVRGQLSQQDPHGSFVEHLRCPKFVSAFWAEHPHLAQRVAGICEHRKDALVELADRANADHRAIETLVGVPLGEVIALKDTRSDPHEGGRSVWIVAYECGAQVVYKPRSLTPELAYSGLLSWLEASGGPGLRSAAALDRGRYGWMSFVEQSDCASDMEVAQFYERLGAHLALLHVFCGVDIHHENLISAGAHPVLIDLEGLFSPERTGTHPAAPFEILQTGMLPRTVLVEKGAPVLELSGVSDTRTQATPISVIADAGTIHARAAWVESSIGQHPNLPTLAGQPQGPHAHLHAFRRGLFQTLDHLRRHAPELSAWWMNAPATFSRVILRPTAVYGELIRLGTHPSFTDNAPRYLDRLEETLGHRWSEPVRAMEFDAVVNSDIPRFLAHLDHRSIFTSSEIEVTPEAFKRGGRARVSRRIASLSERSVYRQQWLLEASLEGATTFHPAGPDTESGGGLDRHQVLRALGNRVAALCGLDGERTLDLRDRKVVPLDNTFHRGTAGCALFLAELGRALDDSNLKRAAIALIHRALSETPRTTGLFTGIDGVALACVWVGRAVGRTDLEVLGADILLALPAVVARHDVMSGAAGRMLAVLDAARTGPRRDALLNRAREFRRALLAMAHSTDGMLAYYEPLIGAKPVLGLSHGAAGVAMALDRLAQFEQTRDAQADRILAVERAAYSDQAHNWPRETPDGEHSQVTWCHGAPGIGLARADRLWDPMARDEMEIAVETTAQRGRLTTDGLCHGNFGNVAIRREIGQTLGDKSVSDRATLSLDELLALRTGSGDIGFLCSEGHQTPTAGLLNGMAGMGLALLGAADKTVPSVLRGWGREPK